MGKKEIAQSLREQGYTHQQIAEQLGVSRQYICHICGKQDPCHFQYVTDKCVYPNLRKWMNDNKVSRAELLRRMGYQPISGNYGKLEAIMMGIFLPNKAYIDKMLAVTGLTYEALFAEDGACDE
jgi:transcriptional regulator with XRE-family HTH domain